MVSLPESRPCFDGDVRTVNTTFSSYEVNGDFFNIENGTFEVCLGGVYGSVCDLGWSNEDAAVLCRYRGFDPSTPQYGICQSLLLKLE